MSAAVDYLMAELNRHHVALERRGDRIKMRAPAPPPDELVQAVRMHKVELLASLPDADAPQRARVDFRLRDYPANSWATCLGRPGESVDELAAALRERYGEWLTAVRP